MGPSQKESLGGGKYFISFIDDCSRKFGIHSKEQEQCAWEVQRMKDYG